MLNQWVKPLRHEKYWNIAIKHAVFVLECQF